MRVKPAAPLPDAHSAKAERILDAAKRAFAANGFAATSVDTIVDEAKVSKSTVYNHYPSKEALFAATVQRETERIAGKMTLAADAADAANQAIEESLVGLARSYIKELLAEDRLQFYRLIVAEGQRFPELGRIFHNNVAQHPWRAFRAILENARDNGELRLDDCELASTQFLALVRGDLQLRALIGLAVDPPMIDHACRQAVATFLARFGSR